MLDSGYHQASGERPQQLLVLTIYIKKKMLSRTFVQIIFYVERAYEYRNATLFFQILNIYVFSDKRAKKHQTRNAPTEWSNSKGVPHNDGLELDREHTKKKKLVHTNTRLNLVVVLSFYSKRFWQKTTQTRVACQMLCLCKCITTLFGSKIFCCVRGTS